MTKLFAVFWLLNAIVALLLSDNDLVVLFCATMANLWAAADTIITRVAAGRDDQAETLLALRGRG